MSEILNIPMPINVQDGINVQTKIRPCKGEFFLKINKRSCIRYTRVRRGVAAPQDQQDQSLLRVGAFLLDTAIR